MAYLRGLLSDTRRILGESPDLLLVAATVAVALVIPHYLQPHPDGRLASGVVVLYRSLVYLCVPMLTLLALRLPPARVGFLPTRPSRWLRDIGLLYALMLPVVSLASRLPSFRHVYPAFAFERLGWSWLLLGLAIRMAGMFAWEFLFRGYMLFTFERRVGSGAAVAIQTVPFVLMHFGKPLPETLGAVVAGIVLGIVALRSRSFVPGTLLHWSVAATLDALALVR